MQDEYKEGRVFCDVADSGTAGLGSVLFVECLFWGVCRLLSAVLRTTAGNAFGSPQTALSPQMVHTTIGILPNTGSLRWFTKYN